MSSTTRRRLHLAQGADSFVTEESNARVCGRSRFVSASLERYRSVIRESDRGGLKKFKDHELKVLVKCFRDDSAVWFDRYVSLDDMPEFVKHFLFRASIKASRYETSDLVKVLSNRTTAIEFVFLIEYIIRSNSSRTEVFESEQIERMAKCLSASDTVFLNRVRSRENLDDFISLLLHAAAKHNLPNCWFRDIEDALVSRVNSEQLRCLVVTLSNLLEVEEVMA